MHLPSFHLTLALIGVACAGCVVVDDRTEPGKSEEVSAVTTNVSAFVLTVSASAESDITVTSPAHIDTCPGGATCNFAYLQGTALTIATAEKNLIDCRRFSAWNGACAGQLATCQLVINSDLFTSPAYRFKVSGCVPQ
jgi:hypothetical protein